MLTERNQHFTVNNIDSSSSGRFYNAIFWNSAEIITQPGTGFCIILLIAGSS